MKPSSEERRWPVGWLLLALGVWLIATLVSRNTASDRRPTPNWQRSILELSPTQQQFHQQLRGHILLAETARGQNKAWPQPNGIFAPGWGLRQQGLYVNYVGEAQGLRWLVLLIEPEPRVALEKVTPSDDEHHTLSDGTPIHVTVWTQPPQEPPADAVTAFPAAEGWVERIRQ